MSQEKTTNLEEEKVEISAEAVAEAASETEAAADAGADTGDGQTVDAIQAELESLTTQLNDAREQVLRAQAEAQNSRRRAEMDVEKAHKYGQEKLVSDLLPVIDNLERALEAVGSAEGMQKAVVEGIELTIKSFQDTLAKHQVVAVNPVGEPFDPQLHQAMTMVESPDAEPNTVLNVFQKGYTLHGRLVRPAMVVVAKAPAQ